ncbi:MAG TPA: YggT family protein [Acidimicrobiales bacterium]|jgi:YggT family protein|nr:YggT family protein [Acidimicrobiales bacterium]
MFGIIVTLLDLFLLVLFAYSILSWFTASGRLAYDSPVRKVQNVLSAICEPVLRPIRRIIPPVRVGGVGLDLSVMVVFLIVLVVLIPLFSS